MPTKTGVPIAVLGTPLNVHTCCPAGLGCNGPDPEAGCALELMTDVAEDLEQAARALARWELFVRVSERPPRDGERRFRRRAYARARDAALIAIALQRPRAQIVALPRPDGSRVRHAA